MPSCYRAPSTFQTASEEIVRQFSPERVMLFGSYAYGEPTPDSDVDLLVTMDMDVRPVDQAVAIRQAVRFPFPLDLLVRTPQQIEERLQLNDPFFVEVMSQGVLLYEATTRDWVEKAEGDQEVAESQWSSTTPVYDAICFHSQQCIEKYLKAWLVELQIGFLGRMICIYLHSFAFRRLLSSHYSFRTCCL